VVEAAHDTGARIDTELSPSRLRKDGNFVCAVPVFGPDAVVHAVQVRTDSAPTGAHPVRAVAAFRYSSRSRRIELADLPEHWFDGPPRHATVTIPEVFDVVEHCDTAMDFMHRALAPRRHDRWEGRMTVRFGGVRRNVQVALRNCRDGDPHAWHGLAHDITDIAPPEPTPLDSATLAAFRARVGGPYLALIDVDQIRLVRWITRPLPGIQWKGLVDDRDTPHPHDIARIRAAIAEGAASGARHGSLAGVRLRSLDGDWTVVDATATVVPTTGPPTLLLVELTVIGRSADPESGAG
jgi:hypothetical protein